jgi:hypothetical protein
MAFMETGQSVANVTKTFMNLQGEKELLKPSKITNAEIASHITGVIRTALGTMINVIESFPDCEIIN